MSLDGEAVDIAKGRRQGAPESLVLWNVVPDDALGDTACRWSEEGYGVALPITAVDSRNRHPRIEADTSQWLHDMVFADDLILVGKDDWEVPDMYRDLCAAIKPWKSRIKEAKLALWIPEAHMVFLGVMLARDRLAAPKHKTEQTWAKFRSVKQHLTTKAIPAKARQLRLRAEIARVLLWGAQHGTSGRGPST